MKLRGKSHQSGVLLGTVSIAKSPHYAPVIPLNIERAIARLRSDEMLEKSDVIIITDCLSSVGNISLSWANIVAIVAEEMAHDVSIRIPAISGVDNLIETAADGMIALFDGNRAILYLEPDAEIIAAYQSEAEKLRPSSRYHIGYEHSTAETLDGKQIRVFANITHYENAETALSLGADGLVLDSEILCWSELELGASSKTEKLLQMSAGKPIIINVASHNLPLTELLSLSTLGDITLCMSSQTSSEKIEEYYQDIQYTSKLLIENEEMVGNIRIGQIIEIDNAYEELELPTEITRIYIPLNFRNESIEICERLVEIVLKAHNSAVAVGVFLEEPNSDNINVALISDIDALIVPPEKVQATKHIIRGFSRLY